LSDKWRIFASTTFNQLLQVLFSAESNPGGNSEVDRMVDWLHYIRYFHHLNPDHGFTVIIKASWCAHST